MSNLSSSQTFLFLIHHTHPSLSFFFFNDTATTEIYTLSLHDALPICRRRRADTSRSVVARISSSPTALRSTPESAGMPGLEERSEEHTSEFQSRPHLVCRLLLEKKKKKKKNLDNIEIRQ